MLPGRKFATCSVSSPALAAEIFDLLRFEPQILPCRWAWRLRHLASPGRVGNDKPVRNHHVGDTGGEAQAQSSGSTAAATTSLRSDSSARGW
jgi:hypothetical protein